ncbi:MAG: HAD-IIA family hydrolase [Fimbriimonadaceae bacterium]
MSRYRAYLFDLDGTVYRGGERLPGTEVISKLLDVGARVGYLTNNSGSTRRSIANKIRELGLPCEDEWVQCTAEAAKHRLQQIGAKSAYVIGDPGLHETLREAGIRTNDDTNPAAVVVGICRGLTYEHIKKAMHCIRDGAPFLATNTDRSYPLPGGQFEPGAGAMVAAVATCSGVEPEVLGKPEPYMVQKMLRQFEVEPHEALVVGDRPETDLEAGRRAGCDTWLVLTGVTPDAIEGQAGSADLTGLPS